MFSRLARLPLRRCLHTAPPPAPRRLHIALGASAGVAAYLAFRLTSHTQTIALDSGPLETPPEPSIPVQNEKPAPPGESTGAAPEGEPSGEAASAGESQEGGASGGAFNPATGEINWDCPCLGGMAHGPCGPQFREAFSCFVFSEDEPKGINCVEKFKAMQNCFREHPEIYADEIDDDDDEAAPAAESGSSPSPDTANNETPSAPTPQTATSEPQGSQPSES
ncbi:hypothetical protein C0992_006193 [Termitomyces sp. T32_za158]|nr:hypothetical protein C0992_006193 [Termitomyces sp. T32_za158]